MLDESKKFDVTVGNGARLHRHGLCHNIPVHINDTDFTVDLYAIAFLGMPILFWGSLASILGHGYF